MTHQLPPAIFIAGSLGLDFLNSIAVPMDEKVEWLSTGRDLVSWLRQAGLLSQTESEQIESRISKRDLDATAAEARMLREWFRGFLVAHSGRQLKGQSLGELDPLNKLLNMDEVSWTIEAVRKNTSTVDLQELQSPFTIRAKRKWKTAQSLLQPIAEALATFICSTDFRYVRACEGKNCTLLFVDETARKGRRWCSMTPCGNRAKQAAHYKRSIDRKGDAHK